MVRPTLFRAVSLGLSMLLGLLAGWLSLSGGLEGWELRTLDRLMWLRGPLPLDPRIVVVEVDEATFEVLGVPLMLWRSPYARVCRALSRAGARAILLDSIFARSWARLPEEDELYQRLEAGDQELGAALLAGPVVMIDYHTSEGEGKRSEQAGSSALLRLAARARGNLAVANLLTDPDGVVRRLPIYLTGERAGFAAGRLAELATGEELRVESDALRLGRLRIPTEQGALRINFPGPGGVTFPSTPFSRLVERVQEGDELGEFRDKVVLIGPGAPVFQDFVTTPLDRFRGQHTLGVEVHAAGLNTILTGSSIERLQPGAWFALVLAAALVGGALATYPGLGAGILGLLLTGIGAAGASLWSLRHGVWVPLSATWLALGSGWALNLAWREASLERSRREMRQIFGRFVSPQVMKNLLRSPANLSMGGRRAPITVLFCDINNFTPTCEGQAPEEVIGMLNAFFTEMLEVIFRHEGTVKQFAGDEIMVLYGAPDPMPEHAARAVQTAVAMVERLRELSRAATGRPGFYEVKIGIHTGQAVVGNVGSLQRSEYAAVGDDVNLAARIEQMCKKLDADILISEATRAAAGDLAGVELKSRGSHEFKGKTRTTELWEVCVA